MVAKSTATRKKGTIDRYWWEEGTTPKAAQISKTTQPTEVTANWWEGGQLPEEETFAGAEARGAAPFEISPFGISPFGITTGMETSDMKMRE